MFKTALTLCLAVHIGLMAETPNEKKDLSLASQAEIERVQKAYQTLNDEPGEVMFTPPDGWKFVDPAALSKFVKVMFIGQSKGDFPPSINLAFDPYKGSLKEYLKIIKSLNDSQGAKWKDLGKIQTKAGEATLLQVESSTKWGKEQQLQAIFLNNGKAWILTTSALKDEFSTFYSVFFETLKSLRVNGERTN